jgi:hypothetical protein
MIAAAAAITGCGGGGSDSAPPASAIVYHCELSPTTVSAFAATVALSSPATIEAHLVDTAGKPLLDRSGKPANAFRVTALSYSPGPGGAVQSYGMGTTAPAADGYQALTIDAATPATPQGGGPAAPLPSGKYDVIVAADAPGITVDPPVTDVGSIVVP